MLQPAECHSLLVDKFYTSVNIRLVSIALGLSGVSTLHVVLPAIAIALAITANATQRLIIDGNTPLGVLRYGY